MLKLVLLTALSGADYCYMAGDEAEFEAEEAQRLIDAGIAKEVEKKKPKK